MTTLQPSLSDHSLAERVPLSSSDSPLAKLRILLISHTCQVPAEGQPKAELIARFPSIHLRVLIPDRWCHYGTWRSTSITPNPRAEYLVGKVRFPWLARQFYFHYYPHLARILAEFRPHLIDLWEEPWSIVSAQTCYLRNKLLPRAKIISETEQNIFKKLPPPFEQFRRYSLRNAAHVIGRSREAVEAIRRVGYSGPATVVPNAVDAKLFRPLDRGACRRKLAASLAGFALLSTFLAGYIGRLVPEKGLLDLLNALPLAPQNVQVLFLGSGPMEGELRGQAAALGFADRVHFLPARPLEELPEIMNALDCFVLPSRTTPRWKEQFGRVIIEAHACAVPVIGSDSGAIADVIGHAGRIYPEGDVSALASALRELAASPELARRLGAVGRRQVEQQYTWQRVAERMATIYHHVLSH